MNPLDANRRLSVIALSATNTAKHNTWRLRVEMLLPYLRARNVDVETRRIPEDGLERRELFDSLRGYDIAWLHRHLLWPSDVRRLKKVAERLVLDIDDPVCYSSSKPFNFALARCLKFRATARGASAVLAASAGLVGLARAHNRNVFLVPLCADPAAYSMRTRERLPGEPLRLLWTGGRSTFKYLEHVRPHLEAVGREVGNVTLTVVGHSQLTLAHLPVVNEAWSRETDERYLTSCHVGLAPMMKDRWTQAKAALKPLQYLASGMPFIGPGFGINLTVADEGRNALLADSPEQWIEAVRCLEKNEALRLTMGENGIRYIRQHHAPEVLADVVVGAFRSLFAAAGSRLAA